MTDSIKLRLPTNRTFEGPKLSLATRRLQVDYDWENDHGQVSWSRVTFNQVATVRYREARCNTPDDIGPAAEIRVFRSSRLLSKTIAQCASTSAGDQRFEGESALQHFHMYFDDAAAIDVVAASVTVE